MSPQLPSFLRRRLRLSDARKALLGGQPELAMNCLSDPCLDGFQEADSLRERVLDLLCREASRHEADGNGEECERLLELVGSHDPSRASVWRRRISFEARDASHDPRGVEDSGIRRESETGMIQALEDLLQEMRGERADSGVLRNPASTDGVSPDRDGPFHDSADERPQREPSERRFRLAVDDVGEFLVCHAPRLLIGDTHAGRADLPITANIDPEHVCLVRTESFHAGPGWRIEPVGGQRVAIGGQLVDSGGAALLDGDEVQLARNLAFVFRQPEAASGSAMLELLHGAECIGASRVLLLAPGTTGRLRISALRGRHLYARRLEEDVTLWVDDEQLVVECAGDLRAEGDAELTVQVAGPAGPGGLRVACPPTERVGFVVGRGELQGPPFGFSVAPAEGTAEAGGEG
jgi:hypothetical protein